MADNYNPNFDRWNKTTLPSDQARTAVAVVPNDTEDLTNPAASNAPYYAKALYIGVSGNVAVICAGDSNTNPTTVTFANHPVGYMPVMVRRVLNTGTTATNIVALMD